MRQEGGTSARLRMERVSRHDRVDPSTGMGILVPAAGPWQRSPCNLATPFPPRCLTEVHVAHRRPMRQ
jgi:hypothetical protein